MEIDLAKLGRFIADHFDLDQLRALCPALGVSYHQLVGETRSAKAFDLVTLMEERGQLSALLAAVAQARPAAFDPQDFQARPAEERTRRPVPRWMLLLGGGIALSLLVGFFLLNRDSAPASAPPTPTGTPAARPSTPLPSTPSAGATASSTATTTPTVRPSTTPSPGAPTHTPTPTPLPATATVRPTDTPTPTASATPSATPILSPLSPALTYDPATRTLRLAPGDATLGRARLCTPLNAYHRPQTIYLLESVADLLALPLPARARVTHSDPERPAEGARVHTLEMLRHPMAGVKVSGEAADFTGCDLLVSEEMRLLLGFPVSLGAFDDPLRFDHGWVTIEFLGPAANP